MSYNPTSIATSHGLTVEKWKSDLFKVYQEDTFFGKFKKAGMGGIVCVDMDLTKGAGDAITFGFAGSLRGTTGTTGNTPLEGFDGTNYVSNNNAMTFGSQRVVIDQVRNAVKIVGKLDEKRVSFNLREQAKSQLTDWLAYNEDQAIFSAINGAQLVATGFISGTGLTYDAIIDMKKEAMFPSDDNVSSGVKTRKIEPIRLEGGEEVFVLGVNPADAVALKKSDDYKTIYANAQVRGGMNPLFNGAIGMINGVIIHEHSSFAVGTPVLMGANAVLLAFGTPITYAEDTTMDYGNQVGFAVGTIRGVALASDDSQSVGAIRFNIAS